MTRNETIGRHGSVESSWSSRSGDTIRPYGRAGSLRGTPVTVKTDKNLNSRYVVPSAAAGAGRRGGEVARAVRLDWSPCVVPK